jgi:hypothetical protein
MMNPSFPAASATITTDQSTCDRSTFSNSCLYFTPRFLNQLPPILASHWYWLRILVVTMFLSCPFLVASSSWIARWSSYLSRNSSAVPNSSNYITKIRLKFIVVTGQVGRRTCSKAWWKRLVIWKMSIICKKGAKCPRNSRPLLAYPCMRRNEISSRQWLVQLSALR